MCSSFWELIMEADQGDLADIVRATGQGGPGPSAAATSSSIATPSTRSNIAIHDWSYDPNLADQGAKFPSTNIFEPCDDQFGDPFTDIKDPLMEEMLDQMPGAVFFDGHPSSTGALGVSMREDREGSSSFVAQRSLGSDHEQGLIKRPTSNIFSRMLQISPSHHVKSTHVSMSSGNSPSEALMRELSPRGMNPAASSLVMNDMIHANPVGVDHGSGMQIISSPRNNGSSSIKRRKSQAKKVVCIPAPAAANSRPSGEVVPSDLWAWRKYGQKPIKGSPYPRGYYRCSSSKGCSARKQVERSRTDPNMLVITYTSEHNHPWPTQRNALAGSTRSQPPKGNAPNSSKGSLSSNNSQTNNNVVKKEPKESHSTSTTTSTSAVNCGANEITTTLKDHHVKEEDVPDPTNDGKKADQFLDAMVDEEFSRGIVQHSANKSLSLADHYPSQQHDDFFADLGELEPDLNLMFCQGFPLGEKHGEGKGNKAACMDPFTHFDWSGKSFGDS